MIPTTIGYSITVMWVSATELLLLKLACVYMKWITVIQDMRDIGNSCPAWESVMYYVIL